MIQQLAEFAFTGMTILPKSDPIYQDSNFIHVVENYWRSEGDEVEDELDGYNFYRVVVFAKNQADILKLDVFGSEPERPRLDVCFYEPFVHPGPQLKGGRVYAVVVAVRVDQMLPGPDGADPEPITR